MANPVLRTRIVQIIEAMLQVVTQRKVDWQHNHSLEGVPEDECQMRSRQPLLWLSMVTGNSNYFVLTGHHVLCDGWPLFDSRHTILTRNVSNTPDEEIYPCRSIGIAFHYIEAEGSRLENKVNKIPFLIPSIYR